MGHKGYAVIDFETTGLSPAHHHRVIEVGVVHVAPDGTLEDSFETVVHPGRDLGPTHIHQLRGADVKDAPVFADITDQLVDHLRGRVLVAHNSRFETTFLRAELSRLGLTSPVTDEGALCTMKLATTFLPGSGRKLADCCAAFDIDLVDAHEALADAKATAQLLAAYLEVGRAQTTWWHQWGEHAAAAAWPGARSSTRAPGLSRTRSGRTEVRHWAVSTSRAVEAGLAGTPSTQSFLDRATDMLRPLASSGRELDYLAVLDRALSDGFLSVSETDELRGLGEAIGVGPARRAELHHEYFEGLVDAVRSDAQLTDAERADVDSVAIMLDIDQEVRAAAQAPRAPVTLSARSARSARAARSAATVSVVAPPAEALATGDLVVLTGEMSEPRERMEQLLAGLGVVVKPGITKKTTLLVAADPDSLSGKAQKARQYGIPIVDEDGLRVLLASV